MLRFFNKTPLVPAGFPWLKKDIHNHLLPALDDGSPDIETSLDLLRELHEAGIREFICTPHIIGDMYRNTPETIYGALERLQKAVAETALDVKLSAAAEYMLDDYFMQLISSGEKLLTLDGQLLLTELPFTIQPSNIEEMAFAINTHHYHPILAHPERYGYWFGKNNAYHRAKELGFSLQLNLLSLTGYYGPKVLKAAKYLLRNNLIDFIGTDLHHINHLYALTNRRSMKTFQKYLGDKVFNDF